MLVTELAIGDGEVAPPQVGDIGRYPLQFVETPPDVADPSIVTVEVDVEPLDDGVPLRQPAPSPALPEQDRWWEWRLFLRSDGWTATWYSRRPTVGRQQLTGRVIGDLATPPPARPRAGSCEHRSFPTITSSASSLRPSRHVPHDGFPSPAPANSGKCRRRQGCSATTPARPICLLART